MNPLETLTQESASAAHCAEQFNLAEAYLLGASPDLDPDAIEAVLRAVREVRDCAEKSGAESAARLADSMEATMLLVKRDLKFDLRLADTLLDAVDHLRCALATGALTYAASDGRAA